MSHTDDHKQHDSHWGATLATGLIAGLAAGLFLRSEKGEELTDEARKAALQAKKQLVKKWNKAQHLSKDAYEELIHEVLERYQDSKELAADQVERVKSHLLDQWEDIRERLEEERDDEK